MASYFTLSAAEGYLVGISTLNAPLQAKAEQWACDRIDERFEDYDREAWSTTTPPQIEEIAEKLAAGRYIELAAFKSEMHGEPINTGADALIAEAMNDCVTLLGQGRIRASRTQDDYLYPRSKNSDARFVEVHPG